MSRWRVDLYSGELTSSGSVKRWAVDRRSGHSVPGNMSSKIDTTTFQFATVLTITNSQQQQCIVIPTHKLTDSFSVFFSKN